MIYIQFQFIYRNVYWDLNIYRIMNLIALSEW